MTACPMLSFPSQRAPSLRIDLINKNQSRLSTSPPNLDQSSKSNGSDHITHKPLSYSERPEYTLSKEPFYVMRLTRKRRVLNYAALYEQRKRRNLNEETITQPSKSTVKGARICSFFLLEFLCLHSASLFCLFLEKISPRFRFSDLFGLQFLQLQRFDRKALIFVCWSPIFASLSREVMDL
ncbi:hypothetical protein PanWU01x14_036300 [Parasponia andersonii]|uniref:Uncharacterized protein n=1 Tax=Parasponia andersonii TaxID=3476 RepID=A0A2P5DSF9_PARAD|nr:hypothetical protein PanWU01x14_036300 [Parasponia andersonii]